MRKIEKAICLTLLSLLILASNAFAQGKTHLRVDGQRIKSYVRYLSTDQMMGRQTMTAWYQEAAEWVAAQYEAWGLEPAGDNGTYFQRVPITRALTWNTGVPELHVDGVPFSLIEGDFSILSASTPATTVDAEVVFVGYGISAPGKGLDEYADVDVQGKIVLALSGSPKDAPQASGRGSMAPEPRPGPEPQEEWVEESKEITKIRTAYENGAAAVLLYDPDPEPETRPSFMRRPTQQEVFTPSRDFLAFNITDRTFRAILKPDPQESVRGLTTRLNMLRTDIKYGRPRSAPTGIPVQLKGYESTEVFSEELGNNFAYSVLAKLPGTHPSLRNEFVVMGGHLDHLGVRDGQVYNGADDNASGTAVVMEVARVLREGNHRPKRTIVFAAWCGEEMGLFGSNYFVANPPEGIDIDKVVTYFNMDMVGLGNAIGAPGALNFPTIWDVIRRDQDEDVIAAVRPSTGGAGGSDHSAFITRGIEALALMTSGGVGHPYYHRPEDDTEMIDAEILRKTGQFVLQGTINLSEEEQVNLLIEDRLTIYNATQFTINSFWPGQAPYQIVDLNAASRDELTTVVLDSALAVNTRLRQNPPGPEDPMMAMMRRMRGAAATEGKTFNRGISDLGLFEGDISLLLAAAEFIGFGRLDIEDDDGYWISGGQLTEVGREVIPLLEENEVWIHLANPSESLLSEMLTASTRPFIVTGDYTIPPSMIAQINQRGVILGITMDPSDVDATIADLDDMKARLGDTDNLVLCVTTDEGMDEAKTTLYMGLLERGWSHMEIAGERRAGGGIAGGNLRVFSRMGARMF